MKCLVSETFNLIVNIKLGNGNVKNLHKTVQYLYCLSFEVRPLNTDLISSNFSLTLEIETSTLMLRG